MHALMIASSSILARKLLHGNISLWLLCVQFLTMVCSKFLTFQQNTLEQKNEHVLNIRVAIFF